VEKSIVMRVILMEIV